MILPSGEHGEVCGNKDRRPLSWLDYALFMVREEIEHTDWLLGSYPRLAGTKTAARINEARKAVNALCEALQEEREQVRAATSQGGYTVATGNEDR